MTTIVVPCYNEAARFPLKVVTDFLATRPSPNFIFVNDGSKDATAEVLRQVEREFPHRVSVIDRKVNRGKAESVREGMVKALENPDVRFVGFWDADLATPLDAIYDLLGVIEHRREIEMIFGARVSLLGREIKRKPIRHYLGRVFATTVSMMLKLPIYDTQCGAKIFRNTETMRTILRDPFLSRWVFDVEIIARWIRSKGGRSEPARAAIYEYPLLKWDDVAGSKVKPYDFVKAFRDVARIYFRYLR